MPSGSAGRFLSAPGQMWEVASPHQIPHLARIAGAPLATPWAWQPPRATEAVLGRGLAAWSR
eukprot:15481130-Alexandrium_andersonii.AAC.1